MPVQEYIPDTLSAWAGAAVADSLPARAGTIPADVPAQLREVAAADVFGPGSTLYDNIPASPGVPAFPDGWLYQILAVVLALLYFYLMLRYRGEVARLFRSVVYIRKEERGSDEYNYLFVSFMKGMTVAAMLMLGIAAVKIATLWMPGSVTEGLPSNFAGLFVLAVMVACTVIGMLQLFVLRFIGRLTFSSAEVRRILTLRQLSLGAMAVAGTPAVLLLALSTGTWAIVFAKAFFVIFAVFVVYYIYKSFQLFVDQKVSILLWFLYLCTLEVMPYGIVILAALRNI